MGTDLGCEWMSDAIEAEQRFELVKVLVYCLILGLGKTEDAMKVPRAR